MHNKFLPQKKERTQILHFVFRQNNTLLSYILHTSYAGKKKANCHTTINFLYKEVGHGGIILIVYPRKKFINVKTSRRESKSFKFTIILVVMETNDNFWLLRGWQWVREKRSWDLHLFYLDFVYLFNFSY